STTLFRSAVLDAVRFELLGQVWVGHANGGEGLGGLLAGLDLEDAVHAILGERDLLHLALAHVHLEVGVRDRLAALNLQEDRLREREQEDEPEDVPDGAARGAGGAPIAGTAVHGSALRRVGHDLTVSASIPNSQFPIPKEITLGV